jgi:hypothetical protein
MHCESVKWGEAFFLDRGKRDVHCESTVWEVMAGRSFPQGTFDEV